MKLENHDEHEEKLISALATHLGKMSVLLHHLPLGEKVPFSS
jgi:hypothetical protein